MSNDDVRQYEGSPDLFDEFLTQLLADIPGLPTPVAASASSSSLPPPPPPPTSIPIPIYQATGPHLTCQWMSPHDPLLICGASLPSDAKEVCTHFRTAHDIRGNEKVVVYCHWRECHVPQMQRGSLIRHILSVHLGLLRWQCEVCERVFSRKGTGHVCADGQ